MFHTQKYLFYTQKAKIIFCQKKVKNFFSYFINMQIKLQKDQALKLKNLGNINSEQKNYDKSIELYTHKAMNWTKAF